MIINYPDNAPEVNIYNGKVSHLMHLAGGSNVSQWQDKLICQLTINKVNHDAIYITNPCAITTQDNDNEPLILWEYKHINMATIAVFWFGHESEHVSTMMMYGQMLEKARYGKLVVMCGWHSGYPYKHDVLTYTSSFLQDMTIKERGRTFYEKRLPYGARIFVIPSWENFETQVLGMIESANEQSQFGQLFDV